MSYYQLNKETWKQKARVREHNSSGKNTSKILIAQSKRFQESAQNKYRGSSEEENELKRKYGRNRFINMSEEDNQRLKDYQKNYQEVRKNKL